MGSLPFQLSLSFRKDFNLVKCFKKSLAMTLKIMARLVAVFKYCYSVLRVVEIRVYVL